MEIELVERLSREVNAALMRREVRERLDKQAFEPKGSTPGELAAYLKAQMEAYGRAAHDAGIRPE